jgi:signal transduction histidine kinase
MVNRTVVPATQAVPSPQIKDRQRALTTIGRLSLSIIHELRNPVAAIYAGADIDSC